MSKITITLDSKATITGLTKEQSSAIMADLTIANPAFSKAQNIGVSPFGVPKEFKYYSYANNELIVPIGYIAEVHKHLDKNNVKIIDNRKLITDQKYFNKHKLKDTIKLRDYQQEIVDTCLSKTIGTIEAMTASGKTYAFISLIFKQKVNTLILVHTIELANQTVDALTNATTLKKEDIGFLGTGKFSLQPISVGLLQTITRLKDNKLKEVNDFFGQIISDEVP
jgi:superfamily II DNA or RNA helicase